MRKAEFITPLIVEEVRDGDLWKLRIALRYYSAILGKTIVVPKGFATDFASVPRLPVIYELAGGKANAPAVIHDFLYHNHHLCTREQADNVLREAMVVEGHPWWRYTLVWAGVRVFGQKPYDDDEFKEHLP